MKENVENPGRNGELAANQPHLLSLPPWDRTLRPGTFTRWKQQVMFFIVLLFCISVSHRIMSVQNLPSNHFQPILLFRVSKIDLAKSALPVFRCPNPIKTSTAQLWPFCQVRYVVLFDSVICILNIKWGNMLGSIPVGRGRQECRCCLGGLPFQPVIQSVILPFLLISSWWLVCSSGWAGNRRSAAHYGQNKLLKSSIDNQG